MRADAARREVHQLLQHALEPRVIDIRRAMRVYIKRHRLRHADSIGKLQRTTLRNPRSHHVFRQIPRHIGRRAVHFCRILARECPTAMRRGAAVGIHDNLAPRQPRIAIRPADDELAGRVHEQLVVARHPALGQHGFHHIPHQLADFGLLHVLRMLGRYHDGRRTYRFAIAILQTHLAFCIRQNPRESTTAAAFGKLMQNPVRVKQRRRHQLRRVAAGETEHNPLIARAFVLIRTGIDALRDIGGLLVYMVEHAHRVPAEALLRVADILHYFAHDFFHPPVRHRIRAAIFAGDGDMVGGGERLNRRPRLGVFGKAGIDDGVGHLVADFVWVALGDGFTGENIAVRLIGAHGVPPLFLRKWWEEWQPIFFRLGR